LYRISQHYCSFNAGYSVSFTATPKNKGCLTPVELFAVVAAGLVDGFMNSPKNKLWLFMGKRTQIHSNFDGCCWRILKTHTLCVYQVEGTINADVAPTKLRQFKCPGTISTLRTLCCQPRSSLSSQQHFPPFSFRVAFYSSN